MRTSASYSLCNQTVALVSINRRHSRNNIRTCDSRLFLSQRHTAQNRMSCVLDQDLLKEYAHALIVVLIAVIPRTDVLLSMLCQLEMIVDSIRVVMIKIAHQGGTDVFFPPFLEKLSQ